ncbi:30S ribosomal protein S6 [Candidatus Daviesbacteria bacterium RIFCSPHIGHO2_12_FULL_37_11]|uniref:Small ribosomal subunit protein bS6 n=1 Tax=Candidatus Daviesbacteria bacterium RIFCSPHIGHO2_12_FULL_37_11 TaxID=1797777 RepID=A0A1F5KAR6_9BACT|nr:MAG: 30S ribosomal protein S6 [Candidatus Daviesbacteria bacterium RIFCSPHIGHO2_01_FULL_37_27]OGE38043.1 MAG: 30S ribosomal protein S6 [Candidatus Daviesbacteria bacterium RIFCSPHIGHO2_12_FULL_37_11]OGE44760.1 MAG: 30S ribosomal protein S6 [Candidatus Daviesbacteria bacterium RIFCSPLOWO2_01_FULL_37_10]
MNSYFLTLVLKPDLEEKTREELLGEIKKKLTMDNGKLTKDDMWGVRDLAYPIKKQAKGFYAHFEFDAEPGVIKGLDNSLKVEENVLRFLMVRV